MVLLNALRSKPSFDNKLLRSSLIFLNNSSSNCPTIMMITRGHDQMFASLYLKSSVKKTNTHNEESIFITKDDISVIHIAYFSVFRGNHSSLVRRQAKLDTYVVKTILFGKNKNNRRINMIHPNKWNILLRLTYTFL